MGREKTPSGESLAQQSPQCSQDSGAPPNPDCEFTNDDSAVQLTGELDKRALLDTFSRHWLLLLMFGMTLFVCNTTNALLHCSAVFGPSAHPSSTHKNEAQGKKKISYSISRVDKKTTFQAKFPKTTLSFPCEIKTLDVQFVCTIIPPLILDVLAYVWTISFQSTLSTCHWQQDSDPLLE